MEAYTVSDEARQKRVLCIQREGRPCDKGREERGREGKRREEREGKLREMKEEQSQRPKGKISK